ncbi:5-formyltetrahydrofolate cyclo-ligase [Yersinia bercovieri]|uniref:5-formyltetrahydrofolate cyclo-ligase n=1 Tax=Yersinia bercovieri TaxID=634 RepID=UPI0005DD2AB2|nr:5-formyltetrahydrofolate cyclo-ligase [Yersinia bercovieri]MCB5302922.1 5-formyltetrahydrofolate cyclo-ligase [Yersinia bercovieri]MDN0103369.1 5-formyltetrahydrofolate cyclo-ligase [Yersinia bercovieri]CFQ34012.1 5-formyltetrahydrofolate cyclo-ligase [Yersinia bercovieri]CNF03196.1 5-formyltetrahydrofolate cyclo-ligase [Yersinia bercovieri]CNI71202.1 5-formyltetrahydrofolate cyclo-ligase [Yersinia bercovieri]
MHLNPQQTLNPQHALERHNIRKEIRARRRLLTPEQQQHAADLVASHLAAHDKIQQASTVAIFLSFDGELNTGPIIEMLWQQQKQVYLPVLHPFSAGNLLFLRYRPDSQLIRNRLKILEPQLDVREVLPLNQLDVVITPLVAFDSHGQRLGMGGGFYDRTLQHWQQAGPYPIGLAHDCQRVEHLPSEYWDVPLPEIVTAEKVWRW